MSSISRVYCDKVVCTSPPEIFSEMGVQLNDLVESCGGKTEVYENGYREIRMPEGGLVLVQQKRNWSRVTINGKACAELRIFKRFDEALGVIGSFPHKVTQIHAKTDLRSSSTPNLLKRLNKVALQGELFGYDYQELQTMPTMRPDRKISLNLYAPKKQAEIQRVYYDKTLERYKAGKLLAWSDDENLSVELRVTNRATRKGLSLRDASQPTALYWHYMADCPIVGKYRPKDAQDWFTIGSSYEYPITRRTDNEKLDDMLRFGGCFFSASKLSAKLGRGAEFLKLVNKLVHQAQAELADEAVVH